MARRSGRGIAMRQLNFWRKNIDFKDFDMYDFPVFETVLDSTTLINRVIESLSPFEVPEPFPSILGNSVYDYCYGKLCNLKNTTRWKSNFLGEISVYLLENGRYLQAYVRDVNKNIELDNTSKVTTRGEEKTGKADTRKTGTVNNEQHSDVAGNNQQSGTLELGDTLTILNNQSTSTNYLASRNDEAYSRGSMTEMANASFGKGDVSSIGLGMENGASLSDTKNERVTDTQGTKSPLDIANEESAFKFLQWMEPLFTILDTYFMAGGGDYA